MNATKNPSKLSYQDRHFSSIANYFICSSSYPPFNKMWYESFLQMMSTISGKNKFNSLTIPHLKKKLNAEHDTFEKAARKVVLDHYEEANENSFVILHMMFLHY